jgi:hypothetical protein
MGGLILLFILCAWGYASYSLAILIAQPIKNPEIKTGVNIALLVLIFIAPVADDIIGGFQFRALCSESAVLVVDEERARGKTVTSQNIESKKHDEYFVPIVESYESYKAVGSNETIISWNVFRAQGGLLSRSLGLFQSSKPYTFTGVCTSPKWKNTIFSDLKITVSYPTNTLPTSSP